MKIKQFVATDKKLFLFSSKKLLKFFLFLNKNKSWGYSSEVPQEGTFNEYPQRMLLLRNKKIIK